MATQPRFKASLLRDEVLALLDSGSAPYFKLAFARVMHARGIFQHVFGQKGTYDFYFRKVGPMVTTALKARQLGASQEATTKHAG